MKLLNILFPIKLYLSIFQLEGYDIDRFLRWIVKNIRRRNVSEKRTLVYTFKTRMLLILSIVLILIVLVSTNIVTRNFPVSVFLALILSTQFYFLLIISRAILYPFEFLIIRRKIIETKQKIQPLKNLKVIAITGSYGKTSVKELLYQLIKDKFKTLRTPESYNTILGISKVVDYELDNTYDFFICEMAAHHLNDIKNLCKMVPPDYAILTGATSQHLERFGSLKNIIKTKFELYESIQNKENIIFNLNDQNIKYGVEKRNISNPKGYLELSNISFSKTGSEFDFYVGRKTYHVKTNLFCKSNIENLSGAITMALKIGVKMEDILNITPNLIAIPHRFSLKNYNNSTIVDNTFSSNEQSFTEMVSTAKMLQGAKVLVTPGLVELGSEETLINSKVGKLTEGVFNKIILVGINDRTKSFAKNLKDKPEFISDTRKDYFEKIEKLSNKYDWIFLENDVTENY